MNLDNIKRVERVLRSNGVMDSREREAEKKRQDRINGNLDYMKGQKKKKQSKGEQPREDSNKDNREKTRRTDVNNANIHNVKEQMESQSVGGIQRLRDKMQGNTIGAIRAVKEDSVKAIKRYEKNFEIENDGER